jgi:hypothetical protein
MSSLKSKDARVMVLVDVFGREVELDENLARLVRALNAQLVAIEVCSARWDAVEKAQTSQQSPRYLYVGFCIWNWWEAWRDLALISAALSKCNDLTLSVDYRGCYNDRPDDPQLLDLYLRGKGNPEQLAIAIEDLAADKPSHSKGEP